MYGAVEQTVLVVSHCVVERLFGLMSSRVKRGTKIKSKTNSQQAMNGL